LKTNVLELADFREAAMLQFARAQVPLARAAFVEGDPFNNDTMHRLVREMFKRLAGVHERNCARIVDLALAGAEDAIEALKDLIAERNAAGLPLDGALGTFATIMSDRPPQHRRPHGRPRENFFANFVIVCLIITLIREFPDLRLRRNTGSGARKKHRRPSACSIWATVLNEAGVGRGIDEEGIRQVWKNYGPLVTPGFERVWPIRSPI
jgi:hypothetical protein